MATIHSRSDQSSGSGVHLRYPRITGFTILEQIHEGSHCSIFRARQDRLGRVVALKVLPEWPPPTDVALERFNRSAYVSAQAPHPNLLTLYDTGARDGYYFASLEFVTGQTLQRQLAQVGFVDERLAINVGLQVARALTALHARDICHRNVKPKNIFIENNGNVRLIGLGLASCKSAFYSPHLDAHAIGTPHFMAPEMIRGCCSDSRSDLYSLGVTLYLMAAGRPPFEAGIPAAVMTRHLTDAPALLSSLRPDLSAGFVSLVHALIAKDPGERLQSARHAVEVLEGLLAQSGTVLPRTPLPPPANARAPQAQPAGWRLPTIEELNAQAAERAAGERRKRGHPLLIAGGSALATAALLFGAMYAVVWFRNARPAGGNAPPPVAAPAAQTEREAGAHPAEGEMPETAEFRKLLNMDKAFRNDPAAGADAWAEYMVKFPHADGAKLKLARTRLDLYLMLMNELDPERPRKAPPAPQRVQQPAPNRAPAGGAVGERELDF